MMLTLGGIVYNSYTVMKVQQRPARCQTKIQLSLHMCWSKFCPRQSSRHCGLCRLSEVRGDHRGSTSLDPLPPVLQNTTVQGLNMKRTGILSSVKLKRVEGKSHSTDSTRVEGYNCTKDNKNSGLARFVLSKKNVSGSCPWTLIKN